MAATVTVPSESDIKALHLYVFDSKKRDLSEGLEILNAIFSSYNTAFRDDFVKTFCLLGINTKIGTVVDVKQATLDVSTFLFKTSGIPHLRAIVQVAEFATPNKPRKKIKAWVVTFAVNIIVPAEMEKVDILFLDAGGSIALLQR
jgi:uncharacterized membrane protein